jgi:hypothetical protein
VSVIPKMKSRKQNEMVSMDIRTEASLLVDRRPDHDRNLPGNDDHGEYECREILPGKASSENKAGEIKNKIKESNC